MLQIRIEDVQLEERIETQAQRVGRTPQEFVRDILATAVTDVEIPRLNPRQHGRVLAFEVPETDELNEVRPFADVADTAEFVQKLRQQAWR